jgi:hypothetical protein
MSKLLRIGLFAATVCGLVCVCSSWAGNSSAVFGTEDYYAGALPPPGFHYINYVLYYDADKLANADGNKSGPPGFKVNALANVFRPIYVADATILGANPAWHVVVPLVHKNVKSDLFDDNADGIGDIYVSPLILGWHSKVFHCIAGFDVIAPTGDYDSDEIANIGNDHWTFEPAVAASVLFPNRFQAGVKFMYDVHTKTTDYAIPGMTETVDYKTGQQFHGDYNLSFAIQPNFQLGVAGYFLVGVTDDQVNGDSVDDSKEQVIAGGPSVLYAPMKNLSLVAKYLIETEAENRPEGNAAWLKLVYSF